MPCRVIKRSDKTDTKQTRRTGQHEEELMFGPLTFGAGLCILLYMKFLPSLPINQLHSEWTHNSAPTDDFGKPYRVVTARGARAAYGPIVRMFATLEEALEQLSIVNRDKYAPYAYVQVWPKGRAVWVTVAKMQKGQTAPVIVIPIEG